LFTKEDVHAELCRLCPDFSGCSGRDHARYLGTEVGRSAEQYQWDHVMRRLFARTVEATGGDNGMMVRLFMCRVYVTSLLLFRAQFRCVGSDMVCFSMGESCRLDTVCTRPSEGPISRRTELSSHGGPRGPAHWPQVARCPGQYFYTLATGPGVSLSRACLILSHACRHDMPIRSNVVRLEAERVGVRARQTLAPSPPSGRIRNFA